MSKQVDERVVSMQFDNRHFESNVQTTMSTLDKLKQKLKFSDASKGLENVSSAAKKVDMSALGNGVETVRAKFSALDVVAVTALANITNSAINAGKRIISALTIDPVTTGFQEYETQINAVQTILANTSSKGTTIDQVNEALDELNRYADLTIYNFTEMTRNIGTFTAAGIDLETSVSAIQGIANLAAVSGSTSLQASTAMYQLSQALAAGTVKLTDWNSVVTAGMGGQIFQDALRETSELLGTGAEAAIKAEGSFRESLTKGWLTSEVLTETLKKFTTSGANEYVAEYTGLSVDAIQAALDSAEAQYGEAEAIDKASEALAQKSGKNKDEIKSVLQMAKTAQDAATKVKTFTQLWDVLKEAAQSGWSATWKIIIGDFEQAKELLTPLSETLTNFINKMSDWRNNILQIGLAFTKPWAELEKKLNNISGIKKIKELSDTVGKAAHDLEYFQDIVTKVWRGDYNNHGDNPDRYDLLEKAGYDHRVVQDLVNKGYQYKLTIEDVEASHKKFGLTMDETSEDIKDASLTLSRYNDMSAKNTVGVNKAADAFSNLSDKQLEQAGLTEDEIALYRALQKEADRLGISVSELAEEMSTKDGRTLLIESFKNAASGLIGIGKAIKSAWVDVFNPPGVAELGVKLYSLIRSFNEFSEKLRLTDKDTGKLNENGQKLQRTFKGVFAVLDIITTILGGGLKIAFEAISSILGAFDLNILDVTASIGDALVAFRDWIFEGNLLAKSFNWIMSKLPKIVASFREWFDVFKQTPAVQKLVEAINAISDAFFKLTSGEINISEFARSLGENLAKALKLLPEIALQIGKDFIQGFQNGISSSITGIIDKIVSFCLNFVSSFAEALGVHSPSWKAYSIICDFFKGAINAVNDMIEPVIGAIKKVGEFIIKAFKSFWDFITDESGNIEWGKIFAGGIVVAMTLALKKIATALDGIAGAIGNLDDIVKYAGQVLKSFSNVFNAFAWDLKAKALLKMAESIAILVAAIYVLTKIDDPVKLWNAVGAITVLAGVLVGLAIAMDKISAASVDISKQGASLKGLKTGLLQIGVSLLLLAVTVKLISNLDPEKAKQGFIGLAGIAVGMLAFLAITGLISRYSKDLVNVTKMMISISLAVMAIGKSAKQIGLLSPSDIVKGIAFMTGFAIFVRAITSVAKSSGNNVSKVGGMIIKLSIAMALMVGICKLIGMLSVEEMVKGAAFAAGFTLFVKALVKVTKIGKKQQLAKISGLILSVSFSLLLMVGICKLIGMLSVEEMVKGAAFAAGFVVLLKVLIKILTIGNEQQMAKVTGTILAMSVAIGILAGIAALLSFMDISGLAKGIIAVGLLSTMMSNMVKSLKGAQNAKGAIMMMAIAIGVMAGAIVALSFIDTKKIAGSAVALSATMAAFALMIKSLKGLNKVPIAPIITLTVVVDLLAVVILALQGVDPLSAIGSAVALSVLLLAIAEALKIINGLNTTIANSLKNMLALSAMVVPLFLFIQVLKQMNGIEDAMTKVVALTILAGAMTLLLGALTFIGKFASKDATAIGIGLLALTAMALPLYLFIQVLKTMNDIEGATEKVKSLVTMMTAMTLLLGALTIIGIGGPAAVIGVGSLAALFAAIGILAVAIGKLMEIFPSIQKFLDTGLPVLEQLAGSIGTMIGKFIGGIGEGISDSLVKMGEDIAAFMSELAKASDNASGIKGESFDGVKKLMVVMAEIGATTVGTTIADIFTLGGTSMDKFQKDGVAFFDAMKAIGEASSGITVNEESIDAVLTVAKKLAELQSSLNSIGGVISFFKGRDDLATFGINAGIFIKAMKDVLENLGDVTFNKEALDSIISASTKLAELQHSLEPIGGVITWFKGRDDLATFGVNIGVFIGIMKNVLGDLDGITFNQVALDVIINAASELAKLQSSLEPIGGVITWFKGRDDLATFGKNLGQFIESMKTALSTLDETGTLNEQALTSVITAASRLSEFQSTLEPMGGVVKWFTGRDDLGRFGTNLGLFADAMKKLKDGMGEDGISGVVVDSVINAGKAIAELQKVLPEEHWFDGKMNLSEFSNYVSDFSEAMSKFGEKASGIDSDAVSTLITTAYRIKHLIEALVDLDTSGLKVFTGIGTGGIGADGAAYKIAQAMAAYSDKVKNIDTQAVSVSVSAALKLKSLIASLAGLDTSSIKNFKPNAIGTSMKSYSDKVKSIDTGAISSSISAATRLKNLISGLSGLDTSGITKFNPSLIGTNLKTYSISVSGINYNSIFNSITAATKLRSFIASLTGIDANNANSFKTAIDELSKVNIPGFVKAFEDATPKLSTAGSKMFDGLIKGMESKKSDVKSTTTEIVSSINDAFENKYSSFKTAGETIISMISKGMSSKNSSAKTAVTSFVNKASSVIKGCYTTFYNDGGYLVEGFAQGITAKTYLAEAKAKAMAEATEKAAREALDIQSPSKIFEKIGGFISQGLSNGIANDGSPIDAIKQKAKDIVSAFGINLQSLGSQGIGSNMAQSISDGSQGIGSNMAQSISDEFEKELKKLDLADKKIDLENTLNGISDGFDDATTYAAKYEIQQSRVILTLAKYGILVEKLGESSVEAQEAYNEYLQEQVDLQDLAYSHSVDWIEQQKKLGEFSLIDELSAWKRVQNAYAEGSDKRIEADSKVLELEKSIESANNDYYNNVIDRTKELSKAQEELTQKYKDAFDERKKAIVDSYGLFDKVEEKEEVKGTDLIDNLMSQFENNMLWSYNINKLTDKGILSDELIQKLREMGPSAAKEIEALTSMTDFQLEKYNRLWENNNKVAENQATLELSGLKDEIAKENETLIKDYNTDLETLRTDWLKSLGIMSTDTATEFSKLVSDSVKTLGDQEKWSEAGANTIKGVIKGINNNESLLKKAIETLGGSVLTTFNNALGIHSPSREFAKSGMFIVQGIRSGIISNANDVYNSISDVGSNSVRSFTNVLSKLSDVINSGMDVQPVISPVIDLSDAKAGIRSINDMFGDCISLGSNGNLGAVSSMMNARIQNGFNNDVISAIDKVRDRMDNIKGTTYNIDGITYDEGSDVAEAIKTLVRAAKIERRT